MNTCPDNNNLFSGAAVFVIATLVVVIFFYVLPPTSTESLVDDNHSRYVSPDYVKSTGRSAMRCTSSCRGCARHRRYKSH